MIGGEVPEMCLAVPGRVTAVEDDAGLRMARVDFGGVARRACLEYLPEAAVGDWVLVHVGFAISRLSESEAAETLRALEALGEEADPEGGTPP